MDRLSPEERRAITKAPERSAGRGAPLLLSALTGDGIEELLRRMDAEMPTDPVVTISIRLPLAEGRTLAMIHALGRVLHSEIDDSHMRLDAEVPASIAKRLRLKEYAVEGTFPRSVS
jgi:GTP-binding protein HflX